MPARAQVCCSGCILYWPVLVWHKLWILHKHLHLFFLWHIVTWKSGISFDSFSLNCRTMYLYNTLSPCWTKYRSLCLGLLWISDGHNMQNNLIQLKSLPAVHLVPLLHCSSEQLSYCWKLCYQSFWGMNTSGNLLK